MWNLNFHFRETKYAAVGLDMNKYGYNVRTYQRIGAEANIPRSDLKKILEVQLELVYGEEPSGKEWRSKLQGANSVNEAAEIFLVRFEGATSKKFIQANKILYYAEYLGKYFQEAEKRRNYANEYYNKFAT